jgi:hypothetical protein
MCATCLGAIPVLENVLGVPFEVAWTMVIINGFLYFLHASLGDPVVPGWITPGIPIVSAFLTAGYPMGPERIQAMVAVQLAVGAIFLVLGITGLANRLIRSVPRSIQAGIILGAAIVAVITEFAMFAPSTATPRFETYKITIGLSALLGLFILFSNTFKELRRRHPWVDAIGKFGMLPAIIFGVIVGPIVGELPMPKVEIGTFFYIPNFKLMMDTVSPFRIGFPSMQMFLAAIPTAFACYIIAFGDLITSDALINGAAKERPDEVVDFNSNRSNLVCAIRNFIMACVAPYVPQSGPIWTAVTAATAQRYKEGRGAMDSIFSGVGTFRMMTAIAVATIPIVSLLRPVLPIALSITLLMQGYVCGALAFQICKTDRDRGIACMMGAILACKGAAWGLAFGLLLHFMLEWSPLKPESKTE